MRSSSIPQSSISTTGLLSHTAGTTKQSYSKTGENTKSHVRLLSISKYRRLQRFWKRGNICQCHPEPSCTALSICLCSSSNRSAINLTHCQHGGILCWPLGDGTNQICSQPSPATTTAQMSPSGETQMWSSNVEKEEEILSSSAPHIQHQRQDKRGATATEVKALSTFQKVITLPESRHIPFFLKGLHNFSSNKMKLQPPTLIFPRLKLSNVNFSASDQKVLMPSVMSEKLPVNIY